LAIGWGFSFQLWIYLDTPARSLGYAALDLALTAIFFQMARRRVFPAPLYVLHAVLVFYHLYTATFEADYYWVQVMLNRSFELELVYIIACAGYRIRILGARA